ncbi:P-loop containing nucleoside triphosphate hydrolase protein [Mycena floridula]|nr:P-loop containing nucleoside triphosphate hydrolase protein [Mycena floridula]
MSKAPKLQQNLLNGKESSGNISYIVKEPNDPLDSPKLLAPFNLATSLGLSSGYSADGRLIALAITVERNSLNEGVKEFLCLVVKFSGKEQVADKVAARLTEFILCRNAGELFAFDMNPLAMSLYHDHRLRVTQAVDIQSAFQDVLDPRVPLNAIRACLGDSNSIKANARIIERVFRTNNFFGQEEQTELTNLIQRSWIACFLATYQNGAEMFAGSKRINTKDQKEMILDTVSKITVQSLRLDMMKPTETEHSIIAGRDPVTGQPLVKSSVYKNQLRSGKELRTVINTPNGVIHRPADTGAVHGRQANLVLQNGQTFHENQTIQTIRSIGRDAPTRAEAEKAKLLLAIAQGDTKILSNPWIKNIWLPESDEASDSLAILSWPKEWSERSKVLASNTQPELSHLNLSQQTAVRTILSQNSHNLLLIQGPPGTGKTSVIASFVQNAIQMGQTGIWLIAQSNVAVKNIAEKLLAVEFTDWRLLVSRDFHFDWHEHIYTRVQENIIRSNEFIKLPLSRLKNCKVFLCTLSMLSSRHIQIKFTPTVPIKTLIVDEASQINIGDYIHCFTTFQASLRKVCFIGDDKQLPPYGQEDVDDLQSIFEVPHLRPSALFLDIQYRMPPQLGSFISKEIYEGQLHSNPKHPVTDDIPAIQFVDAPGNERQNQTGSWMNQLECDTIIKLAQLLQDENMTYKIITPYDAQRNLIENTMKDTEGLVWEDKCFNVDSFQGQFSCFCVI